MQDPPSLRHDPEDAEKELQEAYLQMRLDKMANEPALSSEALQSVRLSNLCSNPQVKMSLDSDMHLCSVSYGTVEPGLQAQHDFMPQNEIELQVFFCNRECF